MGSRILILTDHSIHSPQNSMYTIARGFNSDYRVDEVMVASRGSVENKGFFFSLDDDGVHATRVTNSFRQTDEGSYFIDNLLRVRIDEFDLVLIRFPFPVTPGFFDHLRGLIDEQKILNRPSGIERTSNKSFLLNFPDLTPPSRLLRSAEEAHAWAQELPIVVKPLSSFGGKGIVRMQGDLVDDGSNVRSYEEWVSNEHREWPALGMKFLNRVSEGDKRLVVVNGRLITSSLRVPGVGSWLCNVSQGGSSEVGEATKRELEIIEALTPELLKLGVVMFGVDTLTDDDGERVLSEVNTMSVGGIQPAEIETGQPLGIYVAEEILNYYLK